MAKSEVFAIRRALRDAPRVFNVRKSQWRAGCGLNIEVTAFRQKCLHRSFWVEVRALQGLSVDADEERNLRVVIPH